MIYRNYFFFGFWNLFLFYVQIWADSLTKENFLKDFLEGKLKIVFKPIFRFDFWRCCGLGIFEMLGKFKFLRIFRKNSFLGLFTYESEKFWIYQTNFSTWNWNLLNFRKKIGLFCEILMNFSDRQLEVFEIWFWVTILVGLPPKFRRF